jgi:tripartite-type tricarboxylate transporter receptor subunit TctC
LGVPKNTPDETIDKVNKAMNAILADPKSQARFAALGASLLPGSATDFGKLLADETEKWGKVVKFAGAKPDSAGINCAAIFHKSRSESVHTA